MTSRAGAIEWPCPTAAFPRASAPRGPFIGGEFRTASTGKTFDHIDPTTEEVVAQVASASVEDLNDAVAAAKLAFEDGWGAMDGHARGVVLWKVADAIDRHADELARLETIDMGKPITDFRTIDAPHLSNTFRYFAGWASKLEGSVKPVRGDFLTTTIREPLGVVACITPFNFPLVLSVHKFAPALACGNTIVHKPADKTPLGAVKLAEIMQEAGLPPGVFNVVNGDGAELGDAISAHPDIEKIAFTGSTKVGVGIIQKSAPTAKHVTMELGGKSPNIVFADADLDRAVEVAFRACFANKGEICFSGSRLILERPVYDEVIDRLKARLAQVKIGDPLDPETQMGPQATKADLDHAMGYIDIGRQDGARLVTGGGRHDIGTGKGYFMQPTLYADVSPDMRLAQEEVFGPLLSIIPFDGVEEAIRIGNHVQYGLAGGVQTRDFAKAARVAKALKTGMVWVNTYGMFDPAASFGRLQDERLRPRARARGAGRLHPDQEHLVRLWRARRLPHPILIRRASWSFTAKPRSSPAHRGASARPSPTPSPARA